MQLPVIIPEPCQEQWDKMQARSNGRHCNACQKTVVDFTGWQAKDILAYLKSNQQTCGRFTTDQLHVQEPKAAVASDFSWWSSIMTSGLSAISKMAAAVLLLFHLASCDTADQVVESSTVNHTTTGKPLIAATQHDNDIWGGSSVIGDTLMPPAPPRPRPVAVKEPEAVLMGEPAIVTDSPAVISGPQTHIMGAPLPNIPRQDTLPAIQEE